MVGYQETVFFNKTMLLFFITFTSSHKQKQNKKVIVYTIGKGERW